MLERYVQKEEDDHDDEMTPTVEWYLYTLMWFGFAWRDSLIQFKASEKQNFLHVPRRNSNSKA